MTDARFPEKWLNDRRILRLSTTEFRAFVMALACSVSNRTDGRLEPADLPLVPGFEPGAVSTLESYGLWTAEVGGWRISDFADTQTTAAQLKGLDHKRAVDRERQARKRAHDNGDHSLCLPGNCRYAAEAGGEVPSDVTRDARRDTQARTGQDRTGQARTGEAFKEHSFQDDGNALGVLPLADLLTCHGCAVELIGWDLGPVEGHCLQCSGSCPNCAPSEERPSRASA